MPQDHLIDRTVPGESILASVARAGGGWQGLGGVPDASLQRVIAAAAGPAPAGPEASATATPAEAPSLTIAASKATEAPPVTIAAKATETPAIADTNALGEVNVAKARAAFASFSAAAQATFQSEEGFVDHCLAAAWSKSAELRDEFTSFDAFAAFKKAEADGRVRFAGRRAGDGALEARAHAAAGGGVVTEAKMEAWRAEFASSAELQADFLDAESYAAFMKAAASGQVRFAGRRAGDDTLEARARAAAVGGVVTDAQMAAWREEFIASAELQAEFVDADNYAFYAKAVATGRVRIFAPGLDAGRKGEAA